MTRDHQALRKALSHDVRAPLHNLSAISTELEQCSVEVRDLLSECSARLPADLTARLERLLVEDIQTLSGLSRMCVSKALGIVDSLLEDLEH